MVIVDALQAQRIIFGMHTTSTPCLSKSVEFKIKKGHGKGEESEETSCAAL